MDLEPHVTQSIRSRSKDREGSAFKLQLAFDLAHHHLHTHDITTLGSCS